MAFGGKRGAGERVLESKHVIGLFLLMLLFSGVFFTLGYVMGRNQYDGQVRAASDAMGKSTQTPVLRVDPAPKKGVDQPPATESDPATSSGNSEWEFYGNSKPPKSAPRLEPAPKSSGAPPASKPASANAKAEPSTRRGSVRLDRRRIIVCKGRPEPQEGKTKPWAQDQAVGMSQQ